ncbi:MAG TPA: hypothetical protein VHY37_13455 [Tepidisphaeraceae bacterium]|jgi:hypothetical protein|nr:hypothetical protein [Tepidisphaeraceae bacterium]
MKANSCESVREYLLAAGWDAEGRRQAAEALQHAEQCADCRAAIGDFDLIRSTLATPGGAEPAGGWDAMQSRMGNLLQAGALSERAAARPPVVRPSLAIAAALMAVAAAMFQIGRSFTPVSPAPALAVEPVFLVDPQRAEPAPHAISATEVSQEIAAFQQVVNASDGRAGWMMVAPSSNASDVGMISGSARPSKKVLLLRIDLWHGRDLASNTDLLVLAGQSADLTVPLQDGQSLHYHIGTSTNAGGDDAPAPLFLALELKSPNSQNPLAALATNLRLRPDQRATAGWLATSAGDFALKVELKEADLTEKTR